MQYSQGEDIDINVVGGSTFGIHSKISDEKTYNMFISDGWLINYAGYRRASTIAPSSQGRGIFRSIRGNFMLIVIGQNVYRVGVSLVSESVGSIESSNGKVSIDENLNGQICIVDGIKAYIYNDSLKSLTEQSLGVSSLIPNYVAYHDTAFLIGNSNSFADGAKWYVFSRSTDTTISLVAVGSELALENKPDTALAVVRIPGKGNHVMVFGNTVASVFTHVGGLLNYQRASSSNIDYGVVSVDSIATSDDMVCWLAQNENNAPVIMISQGDTPRRISTDGIDFLLGEIQFPEQSSAFFYRQDGHLFYQITFYNELDNRTIAYDFNESKFYILTDENSNFYPIREIVYFNNKIYGISFNDGNLYEVSSQLTQYDYGDGDVQDIPRIRICKAVRMASSQVFIANMLSIWFEQGTDETHMGVSDDLICDDFLVTEGIGDTVISEDGLILLDEDGFCSTYVPRIDVSLSKNGGQSYGTIVGHDMNTVGNYRNKFTRNRLGQANEIIVQLRFWTRSRMVVGSGLMTVTQ